MDEPDVRKSLTTIALIVLALCTSRFLAIAMFQAFELTGEPLFGPAHDRFADALKTALAQTAVTAPLWHDPDVAAWPALVQRYLRHNEYLQPGMSIQHLPPLSTLLFMGIARLFYWMPPGAIVGTLIVAYSGGAAAICRTVESLSARNLLLPSFTLLLLSYPALFMIDRGNFHSGLTSLLVMFYTFTALYRRWRWAGWLALALAGNVRPNVALFALLEFGRDRSIRETATALVTIGVMATTIGLTSLALAMRIDPDYSLQAFFRAYAWYDAHYVRGAEGSLWNLSLPNVPKIAQAVLGRQVLYDPVVAATLTLLGGLATIYFLALHAMRRIAVERFLFALTAICAIFTPVFAEYHALIFAGPLLIIALKHSHALVPRMLWRGAGLLATLQLGCLIFAIVPADGLLVLVALLALAFPLLARRAFGDSANGETEFVVALACLAALSPLGGAVSHGLAGGLLLFSTLGWLGWRSRTSPDATSDISMPRTVRQWI